MLFVYILLDINIYLCFFKNVYYYTEEIYKFMANTKKSVIPFTGTAEQEEKLIKMLIGIKEMPGAMMPALQKAQEIYGYLPIEVQKIIAEKLEVSLEEVYGVVTFYSQFLLTPKGKFNFSVCLGTACYVKGSGEIYEKLQELLQTGESGITEDSKFSLEATRCIGCCGLAPVMTVNDDVYGKVTTADLAGIIAKYN